MTPTNDAAEIVAPPTFTSDYGILDVMKGRKALARHLKKHGPVRVVIEATLTEPYGGDDGTSIEFNMNVHSVVLTHLADAPE